MSYQGPSDFLSLPVESHLRRPVLTLPASPPPSPIPQESWRQLGRLGRELGDVDILLGLHRPQEILLSQPPVVPKARRPACSRVLLLEPPPQTCVLSYLDHDSARALLIYIVLEPLKETFLL